MKILITTDWYTPSINGVVTSVLNLQKELTSCGHAVRILTLSQTVCSYISGDVTYIGSVGIGKLYPGARIKTIFSGRCVQELIAWQPDVIHSQCEFSTFLIARKIARKQNIPIVHTYHTVYEDYTHYFSSSKKWGRRMAAFFSRRVLDQTTSVIAPTEKVRTILNSYRISGNLDVIPTGIDISRFAKKLTAEQKLTLRQKLDIPEGNRVLLFAGRLAKEKNLEELLHYYAACKKDGLIFLIVGGGPYYDVLKRLTEELKISDSVRFTGMILPEDIGNIYQIGDIFVSASTSETQGLTFMEALTAGLPLLCRRDACLDGVVFDGRNGWLYENQQDFLDKLDYFLSDDKMMEHMSEAAAALAWQMFSSKEFAKKVEDVYHSALCQIPKSLASSCREEFL